MLDFVQGIFLFFTALIFSTLVGLGALRIIHYEEHNYQLLLAPATGLALSAVVVSMAVIIEIPLKSINLPLWFFWISLAAYGFRDLRFAMRDLEVKTIFWCSVLATFFVLREYIRFGLLDYLGSPLLDGWSYVAFGEYLNEYAKGTEGGLAPIYQYAAHLSGTRFAASGLLAALKPPISFEIDTQGTVGLFLSWVVFSYALGVGYAARKLILIKGLAPVLFAVSLSVLGGWVPQALHMNNFDNLLVLSFFPILFSLGLEKNTTNKSYILLAALFISASVYGYPELSPLILSGFFISVLTSNWQEGQLRISNKLAVLHGPVIAILLGLVILAPYLLDAVNYFIQQLSSTVKLSGRPGEGIMPELLVSSKILGAFWGWGGSNWGLVGGFILAFITLLGLSASLKMNLYSLVLQFTMMMALLLVMIINKRYDYGAYKIILMAFWCISILVALGVSAIWTFVHPLGVLVRYTTSGFLLIALAYVLALWTFSQNKYLESYAYKQVKPLKEARDQIAKLHGPTRVLVTNPILNSWAVYFLRDNNVFFSDFQGYMAQTHVKPLMNRSRLPETMNFKYLLQGIDEGTRGSLIWQNKLFRLEKVDGNEYSPYISIVAENGMEFFDERPFVWVGKNNVKMVLDSVKPQNVLLGLQLIVGPSVGEQIDSYPRLLIDHARQHHDISVATQGVLKLDLKLVSGKNEINIKTNYSGRVVPNHNGDPRVLLVGIKVLEITKND